METSAGQVRSIELAVAKGPTNTISACFLAASGNDWLAAEPAAICASGTDAFAADRTGMATGESPDCWVGSSLDAPISATPYPFGEEYGECRCPTSVPQSHCGGYVF